MRPFLFWNGFVFHVGGFGCVQNEVLTNFGNSAHSAQKWDQRETDKKSSHCHSRPLFLIRKAPKKNIICLMN